MGQQREMLEHHAHLVAADLDQLLLAGAQQVAALEDDLAGGGLHQPRQAAHQRGFAGAREAHDDEDLAGGDLDADIAHGADQPGGGQRLVIGMGLVAQQLLGAMAEDLPQAAAAEGA